ncbi:MAG: carbohydrate-binding family 9-like protein [Bacteroidales bacterium]
MLNIKSLIFFLLVPVFSLNFVTNITHVSPNVTPTITEYTLTYIVNKTKQSIIVDGKITDKEWSFAGWSSNFVDIRTSKSKIMGLPKYSTKVKMLYNNKYLYIAAQLEEPFIEATKISRDDTIYLDNDFEIFIDSDSNSENYFEFEINASGTEWDLLMDKPYTENGTNNTSYNMEGLKSAVKIKGSLNDSTNIDNYWTIEIAIPLIEIIKLEHHKIYAKFKKSKLTNTSWRINFSRVEWLNPNAPRRLGYEENWVWVPTGEINMHIPNRWGFIFFK